MSNAKWAMVLVAAIFFSVVIGYMGGKHSADGWWKKQHLLVVTTQTGDGVTATMRTEWKMTDGEPSFPCKISSESGQ